MVTADTVSWCGSGTYGLARKSSTGDTGEDGLVLKILGNCWDSSAGKNGRQEPVWEVVH